MEKVKVGDVFHFFAKPMVAAIHVTDSAVKTGDTLLFQGPSTNFDQKVESLEIDKVHVAEATPGQSVGVKVRDRVRPGDLVYKIVT
ncbi:MAG TPA: translation elongation factor-like protein [Thermoplasmata archaeon]|nr:translation elongation factor-like protein [Thermoplasmata archaeon]